MSAIGRISGPLLKSNLIRNGIDLAFETDLLYLDVNNQRIGIKTATPQHELDVNGTTRTTNLVVTNRADIGDVNIVGNTISSDGQYLNLGTLDNVVYQNKLRVDSIDIEGNVISTNNSNTNLELRPNGTGSVDVYADMNVTGNIHATGNISADGNIIVGNADTDSITFNAEVASNIIPNIDKTYNLGAGGTQYDAGVTFSVGDVTITITSGVGTLSVPASGPAWVNDITSRSIGYKYLLALEGFPSTLYDAFSTSSWIGVNPQQVSVTAAEIPDGTYNVVRVNLDAKRWNDVWVDNIITGGINTGTIVVDGIDLTLRQGNIFYVAENGSNSNTGNHPQDPFATLKHALTLCVPGDTVYLYPGVYQEIFPIIVPAGVTVKGHGIRAVKIVPTVNTQNYNAFLLNGETTVEDLTVADFYSPGYAFRFEPGFTVTSRSPYVRNVTVITKGSVTTEEDPRGFNQGDAGKGAYLDGSVATAGSKEASCLFHSVTFITPGVDCIELTNGVRVEWLNCFTYFANRSIYAYDGSAGIYNDGKTRIRLGGVSGTFSAGNTVTFTSTDSSTVVNVVAESVENNEVLVIDGKNTNLLGFDTTPASISNGSGATATTILNIDLQDFGAEVRLIGSASVYGNFGLVGDGPGVLMYAIGHNLAYIGNGKEVTNDPGTVIQANEVVELNDARIRYNSVDHKGDFRVGDLFYVNQETGSVAFSVSDFIINTTNGVTFVTGSDTTFIDGSKIETGDWRISGNTIETLTQDANFTSATGQINLQDNVDITGDLDVTGNVTIGGNIVIGDEATDTIQIVAGIDSDIIPRQDSTYSLGTAAKTWANLYVNQINVDGIRIRDNYIETVESNANLELRANGTGVILAPSNNVEIDNNLTVDGLTTLANTNITGTITLVGDFNQTGNYTLSNNLTVGQNLTVGAAAQFEEILIDDNFITTTTSNTDLELRAAGTGSVIVPNNDVEITNDLTVGADISANNLNITGNITTNTANIGDVFISGTTVEATASNADLELRANGTGDVLVPTSDVILGQDLTVNGTTSLQSTSITGTLTHVGNTNQTGNVILTGDWTNGNISISDNIISTTQSNSDLELVANGAGLILVPTSDVILGQDLTVSGVTDLQSTSITGTLTQVGDTIQTGNYTITGQFSNGNIVINDNFVTTTQSNSNLELRANGTGVILVPNNDVEITNDLTVSGLTTLANTNITGTLTHIGGVTQTGNINLTGNYSVTGTTTVSGAAQFEDINITNNVITTTLSNSDLELRAAGTGEVIVPNNDVRITNDLYVDGTITVGDISSSGTITANRFSTGDILIDDNFITTTVINSDLELRANGTGEVVVPQNDVILEQDLTVNGTTNLKNTNIVGNIVHTGDTTQTGNLAVTGALSINGNIAVAGGVQFENIRISGNVVETTLSNSDLELRANGSGQILIPSDNVTISNSLTVLGTLTVGDIVSTGQIQANRFFTGDILVDDNYITTTTSNSDLELRTSGTGSVIIDTFDINGSTIATSGDMTLEPGSDLLIIDATGSLRLPVGTTAQRPTGVAGQIRYNSELARFEGFNGTNWINLKGVEDLDGNTRVTAELTEGANDNTIRFYTNGNLVVDINSTRLNANSVIVDSIQLDGNVISTITANADLVLSANGTGSVVFDNFAFRDNTITNRVSNSVTIFENTNNGYVKFDGTYGLVLPVGNNFQRPPLGFTEIGMTRFNTEASRVEVYDGTNWVSAAGTQSGITFAEAEDIALQIVLSLG